MKAGVPVTAATSWWLAGRLYLWYTWRCSELSGVWHLCWSLSWTMLLILYIISIVLEVTACTIRTLTSQENISCKVSKILVTLSVQDSYILACFLQKLYKADLGRFSLGHLLLFHETMIYCLQINVTILHCKLALCSSYNTLCYL